MKRIPLTKGKYAIVDNEDYHYLSRFKWSFVNTSGVISCVTQISNTSIYMHQMILPAKKVHYWKHINNNNLDNRKQNLELISANHRRHLGHKKVLGASKYRGVQNSSPNTWRVVIQKDKKRHVVGIFKKIEEKKAALAYNEKALELYGKFAYQNKCTLI